MLDIHQGFNDTSTTPTPTELNKKNTIAKRINLNKPNVNSNTSDVVSNQSIINMDNNQSVKNNRNYGDAGGRISNAQHTAPPSDSANLNNNVATIDNYTAARVNSDGDSTKAIHMVSNVNKLNAKVSGHQINRGGAVIMPTVNYVSNKHSHESNAFNERKHFNQLTGKLISSAATAAYMTNDIPPFTNCVETRLPLSFAHNHEDIVNYVVSGKMFFFSFINWRIFLIFCMLIHVIFIQCSLGGNCERLEKWPCLLFYWTIISQAFCG